jgi:hypothetical protein
LKQLLREAIKPERKSCGGLAIDDWFSKRLLFYSVDRIGPVRSPPEDVLTARSRTRRSVMRAAVSVVFSTP